MLPALPACLPAFLQPLEASTPPSPTRHHTTPNPQVYTARWNEAPVAVKRLDDFDALLHSEPPETQRQLLDALHAEAGLMAGLRQPNIVGFMAICAAPPAIVTELCTRRSLTDVLKAAKRDPASLPWPLRLRMAIGAAAGMHHLHCHSPPIIHRDLKSPNLLVAQDWTVKVLLPAGCCRMRVLAWWYWLSDLNLNPRPLHDAPPASHDPPPPRSLTSTSPG